MLRRVEIKIDEEILKIIDKKSETRSKFILDAINHKIENLDAINILNELKIEIQNLKTSQHNKIVEEFDSNLKIITNKLEKMSQNSREDYEQIVQAFNFIAKKIG